MDRESWKITGNKKKKNLWKILNQNGILLGDLISILNTTEKRIKKLEY